MKQTKRYFETRMESSKKKEGVIAVALAIGETEREIQESRLRLNSIKGTYGERKEQTVLLKGLVRQVC